MTYNVNEILDKLASVGYTPEIIKQADRASGIYWLSLYAGMSPSMETESFWADLQAMATEVYESSKPVYYNDTTQEITTTKPPEEPQPYYDRVYSLENWDSLIATAQSVNAPAQLINDLESQRDLGYAIQYGQNTASNYGFDIQLTTNEADVTDPSTIIKPTEIPTTITDDTQTIQQPATISPVETGESGVDLEKLFSDFMTNTTEAQTTMFSEFTTNMGTSLNEILGQATTQQQTLTQDFLQNLGTSVGGFTESATTSIQDLIGFAQDTFTSQQQMQEQAITNLQATQDAYSQTFDTLVGQQADLTQSLGSILANLNETVVAPSTPRLVTTSKTIQSKPLETRGITLAEQDLERRRSTVSQAYLGTKRLQTNRRRMNE